MPGSQPHENRPVPALSSRERRELARRLRSYVTNRPDGEPPPWVLADQADTPERGAIASFVALTLAKRSKAGEPEAWLVRGVLRRGQHGPPILTRVAVDHFSDSTIEITSTAMRGIRFDEIRKRACENLALKKAVFDAVKKADKLTEAEVAALGWADHEKWLAEAAVDAARAPRRGPKGMPDAYYRRIAERYLELVKDGRRDVVKALADELAAPIPTVRDRISTATKRGFLAGGKQGRATLRPGPNLDSRRRKAK